MSESNPGEHQNPVDILKKPEVEVQLNEIQVNLAGSQNPEPEIILDKEESDSDKQNVGDIQPDHHEDGDIELNDLSATGSKALNESVGGDHVAGNGAQAAIPDDSLQLDLQFKDEMEFKVRYKTKWANLVIALVVLGIFCGFSFIKPIYNWIIWIIFVICLIFISASFFDFLQTPTWVKLQSNRSKGVIKLRTRLRSFHTMELQKHSSDLKDVVFKTNHIATQNKNETPEIVSHTVVLVFSDSDYLYFNVDFEEQGQDFREFMQKIDDFHFNGEAPRSTEIREQDFQYFKVGQLMNGSISFILSCSILFGLDYLIKQSTMREYSF